MFDDPTEALREYIKSKSGVGEEVQRILDRLRTAGASDQEACDALQTFILGQMYGSLRKTNPMLAVVEEAKQVRDLGWW